MTQYVEISFDCLPLRTIGRVDIPLDASPAYRAKCERIKDALAQHGAFNSYYLHNARCAFHLTNDPQVGTLDFRFEGTALTDETDQQTRSFVPSLVELSGETCDWLTRPIVEWFHETLQRAVVVEFDRYIAAGDLQAAKDRIQRIQREADAHEGYLGMYL